MGLGACGKIPSTREQYELHAAGKFFLEPVGKVPGLGVQGLNYHVLGMKMVVSDQSNWS